MIARSLTVVCYGLSAHHEWRSSSASSRAGQGAACAGVARTLCSDASNQRLTVCSHHLPRGVERCVSVAASDAWGSAYCASVHLADAASHDLVEITVASGNAQLERLLCVSPMSTANVRRLVQKLLSTYLTRPAGAAPQNDG